MAARAGDSPFEAGAIIPAGTVVDRDVFAWAWPGVPDEPPIPFAHKVVRREKGFLIAWKPHFLPTTSNGRIVKETLQTRIRVEENNPWLSPVHRLDRLTAGLVLCSDQACYQQLFARREVEKTYRAKVSSHSFSHEWERLDLPMRKAGRRVEVHPLGTMTHTLVRGLTDTTVELRPKTGHTHQLRVALNHVGSPIVGDDTYPQDSSRGLYDFTTPLELFAVSLKFVDPVTGGKVNESYDHLES